jgi:hypothetical protein
MMDMMAITTSSSINVNPCRPALVEAMVTSFLDSWTSFLARAVPPREVVLSGPGEP